MTGLALALLAAAAAAGDPGPIRMAQLSYRSRIVVRIQARSAPPPVLLEYHEKKGPRCIPTASIAGAAIVAPTSVDFILRGGQRLRARFDSSCPALDFYSGFYLTPGGDGRVCADRDAVRSRAGGECAIDKFRLLVGRPRR